MDIDGLKQKKTHITFHVFQSIGCQQIAKNP